jgi:hypothetical protein
MTACAAVLHSAILWFGFLWAAALLVGRVYAFHDAYQTIVAHLERGGELRARCLSPAFVALLHDHPAVCAAALHEADVNPWLKALHEALNAPTLCGRDTCADLLAQLAGRGGWTAAGCALLAALLAPQLLLLLARRGAPPLEPVSAMFPYHHRHAPGKHEWGCP